MSKSPEGFKRPMRAHLELTYYNRRKNTVTNTVRMPVEVDGDIVYVEVEKREEIKEEDES